MCRQLVCFMCVGVSELLPCFQHFYICYTCAGGGGSCNRVSSKPYLPLHAADRPCSPFSEKEGADPAGTHTGKEKKKNLTPCIQTLNHHE